MPRLDLSPVSPVVPRAARLHPASLALPLALALAGCSGFGHYESDAFTLPGANPDEPAGMSENMLRVENKPVAVAPVTLEQGNVWPGAPQPFPTLGEVEKETQNGQVGVQPPPGASQGPGGSPGVANQPPSMGAPGKFEMHTNPNAASTITIPNGNGTSTVIAPDGSVKVIPTPGDTSGTAGTATPASTPSPAGK